MTGLVFAAAFAAAIAEEANADATQQPESCCVAPSRWAVAPTPATIVLTPTEGGAVIAVGDQPFAEYRADGGGQPVVWPIYGPSGHTMTRSWPLGPRLEAEEIDHPHHRSLWFAHGDVNGHDFWHGSAGEAIVHREFVRREVADGVAVVESVNDWVAGGETIVVDRRTFVFGVSPMAGSPRYIDVAIRLSAPSAPVVFGDTKEGTFAFRVPGPMKVKANLGGRIVNRLGHANRDAWGRRAEWVVYTGPLTPDADGPRGGVAIFAHPASFAPTPRWQVRPYGLFAANPFGESPFAPQSKEIGGATLAAGDKLVLQYRVALFDGHPDAETIAAWRPGIDD